LKIDALKRTLATLHFPDRDLLKTAGLAPLAGRYNAYALAADGKKLCVLVSKGVMPQAASKLPEGELQGKVVVLEQQASKWARIWPSAAPAPEAPPVDAGPLVIIED
jgi:hypothetical protein